MKPIKFSGQNTIVAKEQEQYIPLPAFIDNQKVVTCWQLDEEDLKTVNRDGVIYLRNLTFGQPLQPIYMSTTIDDIVTGGYYENPLSSLSDAMQFQNYQQALKFAENAHRGDFYHWAKYEATQAEFYHRAKMAMQKLETALETGNKEQIKGQASNVSNFLLGLLINTFDKPESAIKPEREQVTEKIELAKNGLPPFDEKKHLNDVALGCGINVVDLVQVYQEVRENGIFRPEDFRRLISIGVPIKKMMDDYGAYMHDAEFDDRVKNSPQTTYEDFVNAIRLAVRAGGIFYNVSEKAAATLKAALEPDSVKGVEPLDSQMIDAVNKVCAFHDVPNGDIMRAIIWIKQVDKFDSANLDFFTDKGIEIDTNTIWTKHVENEGVNYVSFEDQFKKYASRLIF